MSLVTELRRALPYLRLYGGKIFVVKMGGEVLGQPERLDGIASQLAILHHLKIHVVVVHGGGPQATELAGQLGLKVDIVNGRRVTDERTLDVAKMVFNGKLNTEIVAALDHQEVPAVGLSGVDCGLICARRRPPQELVDRDTGKTREVDFGFVGDVELVNPAVLQYLVNGSYVPVVSALAGDSKGGILNMNGDTVAAEIAIALKASKLLFLTPVIGVLRDPADPASLISQVRLADMDELLAESARGGMTVKLEVCRRAIQGGVPRAHIISGLESDSLLREIFTNDGSGTLVEA